MSIFCHFRHVFYYDILPEENVFNTEERQLWFVVSCCQYDDSFVMSCSSVKALSRIYKTLKATLFTLFRPSIFQAPGARQCADLLKMMYA